MSVRYTIENLKKMRESAGLGVLSMGVCAISGELVSSTPIPGSRCGHVGQDPAEYGGYLLGEGMTREAALYLANLHNHFPALAEAVNSHSFECLGCGKVVEVAGIRCAECKDGGRDGDASYLEAIGKIAEKHGWNIFEGPLGTWIDEHLTGPKVTTRFLAPRIDLEAAQARAEAAEAQVRGLEAKLEDSDKLPENWDLISIPVGGGARTLQGTKEAVKAFHTLIRNVRESACRDGQERCINALVSAGTDFEPAAKRLREDMEAEDVPF